MGCNACLGQMPSLFTTRFDPGPVLRQLLSTVILKLLFDPSQKM